jgi:hypothetical protein
MSAADETSETCLSAARYAVEWHNDVAELRYGGGDAGSWYDRQAYVATELAKELVGRRWDSDALDYLTDALESAREVGD